MNIPNASETQSIKPLKNSCKELPPLEFLHECFNYDPESGILYWKNRPRDHFMTESKWKQFNKMHVGKPAGCKNLLPSGRRGYMQVHIRYGFRKQNTLMMVHRICATMSGNAVSSDVLVDHINGDVWDNRACNLRVATYAENSKNCKAHKDKESGLPRGVVRSRDKFLARITVGTYLTPELAHEAFCKAARLLHGEFAGVR